MPEENSDLEQAMASGWWPFIADTERGTVQVRMIPEIAALVLAMSGDDSNCGSVFSATAEQDPEQDMFERLENEMAADNVAEAGKQALSDARAVTQAIFTEVVENGTAVMNTAAAEKVLAWLNRAMVLARGDALATAGEPQSGQEILGVYDAEDSVDEGEPLSFDANVMLHMSHALLMTLEKANM